MLHDTGTCHTINKSRRGLELAQAFSARLIAISVLPVVKEARQLSRVFTVGKVDEMCRNREFQREQTGDTFRNL